MEAKIEYTRVIIEDLAGNNMIRIEIEARSGKAAIELANAIKKGMRVKAVATVR